MHRSCSLAAVVAVALVGLLAGCASSTPGPVAGTTSAVPSPTEVDADPAATAASDPFTSFVLPLRADAPAGLDLEIAEDRLVTWKVPGNDDDKIRVMAPMSVQPDGATPSPAPADYHAYLASLKPSGAVITDDAAITVDGVAGHEFTITSRRTIDSGLGCYSDGDPGCFGLPPDLTLRMATFAVEGQAVVLWARTTTTDPDADLVAEFEDWLPTVRFER